MANTEKEPPVIACALAANEYKERSEWIQQLNAQALRGYRRNGSRIVLTYNASARATVREFVDRERVCCPFLDFTVSEHDAAITVTIATPDGLAPTADELFAPYTAVGRSKS
jgi:hypothetical protein